MDSAHGSGCEGDGVPGRGWNIEYLFVCGELEYYDWLMGLGSRMN